MPSTPSTPRAAPSPRMAAHDVLLAPTLLAPPPYYGVLDQPRGTTRAFFDVEFAHTGWTTMANVTGWAAISLPHKGQTTESRSASS